MKKDIKKTGKKPVKDNGAVAPRNKNDKEEHKIAPGNDYELNREATAEEIKRGDFTRVYRLSFDEVDESLDT